MFSFTFKNTFVFLLLFSFVGQVTASVVMSCEMPNEPSTKLTQLATAAEKNIQQTMHEMHGMEKSANNTTSHDCCADDESENSNQCSGNCQCLIGGCSQVYNEPLIMLTDTLISAEQALAKITPSPRTQFLSFLFRPPIV